MDITQLIRLFLSRLGVILISSSLITACLKAPGDDSEQQPEDPVEEPADDSDDTPVSDPLPSYDPAQDDNLANGWQLVWSDEFDDQAIDGSKWSFEQNCWGGGNGELQCYTNRDKNAYINEGKLVIAALKESYSGPAENDDSPNYDPNDTSVTKPYTSARLRTKYKGDWKYGRFEIKAKPPIGQGSFPAVWMLPTDWEYGTWAASGEIDIAEWLNLKTESDDADKPTGFKEARIHGTLHYGQAWPNNVYSGTSTYLANDANPADDFHVYAIEWEEGEIRWFIDGVHYATQTSAGWYSKYENDSDELVVAPEPAPFNQNFHLIINNAVGGDWAVNVNEKGVDESIEERKLEIEYVRVYQCSEDTATGIGCGTISESAEQVEGHQPPAPPEENPELGQGTSVEMYIDSLHPNLEFASYNPDSLITMAEVDETDRGKVLQVTKTGATGNVFFAHTPNINLENWQANGSLSFDLNVISQEPSTQLDVKLDSGWPNVSPLTLTLPNLNTWTHYSTALTTILANDNPYAPGNYADITNLANPFVVEPNGEMDLLLDNVKIEMDPTNLSSVNVFDSKVHAPFHINQYVASGEVLASVVTAEDPDKGEAVELTFNTDESVVFFQSINAAEKYDVSNFDYLEFDLLVVEDPRADRQFRIKMDCGFPCGSGDYTISAPEIGTWTNFQISLTDLVGNNTNPDTQLDLSQVDTPLVIFPAWGNQNGVKMQIDNIALKQTQP